MTQWLNKIDIGFAHLNEDAEDRVKEVGPQVSKMLIRLSENLRFPPDLLHESDRDWAKLKLEEIADYFDMATDFEEFNGALEELYDFGDSTVATKGERSFFNKPKMLWVDFQRPEIEAEETPEAINDEDPGM